MVNMTISVRDSKIKTGSAYLNPQRKKRILSWANDLAKTRAKWIKRNRFYYQDEYRYLNFLIPQGSRILEIGCGTGQLLAALSPAQAYGVDLSPEMTTEAQKILPEGIFITGDIEEENTILSLKDKMNGEIDYIIINDTLGMLDDCQATLANIHKLCSKDTRIIIAYYSKLWEPILRFAERIYLRNRNPEMNWLSRSDIINLLKLETYDVISSRRRLLIPRSVFGLGRLCNISLGMLPGINRFCLRNYIVCRSLEEKQRPTPSVTVLVPCRNEKGNIEAAVSRTPLMAPDQELLFVEGNSSDGTWEEIQRVKDAYPELKINALQQPGKGKGDAVRCGFEAAEGDILMILDADLTVPPEVLPRFYHAVASGKGEYVNGTRLIYPMEEGAMRPLNYLANRSFAVIFSWLIGARMTDTLCGTKVLSKDHYQTIAKNRAYFGDFDPFGDFDLIFGATKSNLKMIEIPVRYASRSYGETQISRFRDGWELLKMVLFAARKLKFF